MRDEVFPGVGCAVAGALLPLPYAAAVYEQANALSCCENPGGDGLLLGFIAIPIATVLMTPLMVGISRLIRRLPLFGRLSALIIIGAVIGSLVGWALFKLTLLPPEMGSGDFAGWGVAPGAIVGAGAAIGWWFGSDALARFKKVKNG